ncbi:hypothetical protein Agub_g6659, partial [Astrephomene gubernaculifera]
MLRTRHLRDAAARGCPHHRTILLQYRRERRSCTHVGAASTLAVPHINPCPTHIDSSCAGAAGSAPVIQHILLASSYAQIKEVFAAHRTNFSPTDLTVAWVRLAKISSR